MITCQRRAFVAAADVDGLSVFNINLFMIWQVSQFSVSLFSYCILVSHFPVSFSSVSLLSGSRLGLPHDERQ